MDFGSVRVFNVFSIERLEIIGVVRAPEGTAEQAVQDTDHWVVSGAPVLFATRIIQAGLSTRHSAQ